MEILDEGFSKPTKLDKKERLEVRLANIDIKQAYSKLNHGRIALFFTGCLFILGIVLSLTKNIVDPALVLVEGGLFCIVIFASGVLLPKNPKLWMSIGTGTYLLNIIIHALVNPMSVVSGILFKIILIAFLIRGIAAAVTYQDAVDKLKKYGEEVEPKFRF